MYRMCKIQPSRRREMAVLLQRTDEELATQRYEEECCNDDILNKKSAREIHREEEIERERGV